MATETNNSPSGPADQKKEQKAKQEQPKQEQAPAGGAPKLSNAELKAKKQAEKAARRAQTVAAKAAAAAGAAAAAQAQAGPSGGDSKGSKQGKSKQDGTAASAAAVKGQPAAQRRQSTAARPPPAASVDKDPAISIPECFSHIPVAKRIPLSEADKDVHPAVLAVGQSMGALHLRDNISRLEATLLAFKKVLKSYETPQGHVFSRYFVPHVLNPQIEYLTECRPMCFSMGNAIRLLKSRVTKLDVELPDEEAVKVLSEAVDNFIEEKIAFAEYVIANNAAEMIIDGDVILTYGHARLVRKAILEAWKAGKNFEVAIVDDAPYNSTGQGLATLLKKEGIRVAYHEKFAGLRVNLGRTTKVMIGAEAMFANGSLYGPAGTCDIAMTARDGGVPVIALCETINFDRDRVATESLTYNEIDPERCSADSFRLLFDTTSDKYLTVVVTEYETGSGNSPATAITSILRKQEDPN
ncbi:Nagb/rpia/CoA transferase-like protein [Pleurostoma richardsiae]|uniref:Translation initiation factor eIF2B subunit delta n=1 Tax=Pleurostoma richardsiae TaxID=41990 RepID=A0AA38VGE4_9PEZI|nr:Nagb/rpia/CoA transferase-like protein [Pleurostoma richardsiae]